MIWVKAWNAAERTGEGLDAMELQSLGKKVLPAVFCRKTRLNDTKPKYLLTKIN